VLKFQESEEDSIEPHQQAQDADSARALEPFPADLRVDQVASAIHGVPQLATKIVFEDVDDDDNALVAQGAERVLEPAVGAALDGDETPCHGRRR
jgi:hypothetical protein